MNYWSHLKINSVSIILFIVTFAVETSKLVRGVHARARWWSNGPQRRGGVAVAQRTRHGQLERRARPQQPAQVCILGTHAALSIIVQYDFYTNRSAHTAFED